MAKFFVILFCLSVGCFVSAEASPFFFNIQKSYVSQPAQATSQTTVSQSVDFGLGGLVSKWLALSQIFTDKLVGKMQQRPRPTQRPVVEVDSVYKPEKLSTTTTESPAELIGTTTDRFRTTDEATTIGKFTTTERSTTSDRFTTTEGSTTERSSTSSYSTERSTTSDRFTTTERSTTQRSSTSASTTTKPATDDTDIDTDGSDNNSATAFTTDRTTTSATRRTTSYTDRTTNGYDYTTPSTTRRTTSTSDRTTNGYDINAPYTTDRMTSFPTADRTTTPHGYEYNTPSTPYTTADRTTSPHGYEYPTPTPSTTIRRTSLRPTTSDNDNEVYTGEEDNANGIKKPWTGEQVTSRTYLPPVMTRFSSAFNGAVSANAISRGRVSASALPANAIFKGTVSASSVSIADSSSQSANARSFDIVSENEEGDFDNGRGFQGTDDVSTGGIDPRSYYFY